VDLAVLDHDHYWSAIEAVMRETHARVHDNPWLIGMGRLFYNPPDDPDICAKLDEILEQARNWQAELIRRGQAIGVVRDDLPIDLLLALLVGADEAADRWFVTHWNELNDSEIDHLFAEIFAVFRRMLEPPPTD
jgi:hypothetical protein